MGIPEQAKRIRAARAYAALEQPEMESLTGISKYVIRRMEAGTREANTDELIAIAKVCGLPFAFFAVDFDQLPTLVGELPVEPLKEMSERLEKIEKALALHDANSEAAKALLDLADGPRKKNAPGE